MIDLQIVKEQYSRMSDEQLIDLVKTGKDEITEKALIILKMEFSSRRLNMSLFDQNIADSSPVLQEAAQQTGMIASNVLDESLWQYAFDLKKEGKTDKEVLDAIKEKGATEENAADVLNSLVPVLKSIISAHSKNMQTGLLICGAGLVITFSSYSLASGGGTYIVAWGAILFGAIRMFKGFGNKEKYEKILASFDKENNPLQTKM